MDGWTDARRSRSAARARRSRDSPPTSQETDVGGCLMVAHGDGTVARCSETVARGDGMVGLPVDVLGAFPDRCSV